MFDSIKTKTKIVFVCSFYFRDKKLKDENNAGVREMTEQIDWWATPHPHPTPPHKWLAARKI